jgi:hypothetical protein
VRIEGEVFIESSPKEAYYLLCKPVNYTFTLVLIMPALSSIIVSMNRLGANRRAQIISSLIEGNSLRSTSRMTGVAINTVVKLAIDAGATQNASLLTRNVCWRGQSLVGDPRHCRDDRGL